MAKRQSVNEKCKQYCLAYVFGGVGVVVVSFGYCLLLQYYIFHGTKHWVHSLFR